MKKKLYYLLRSKRGDGYVDTVVLVFVCGLGLGTCHTGTSCFYPKATAGYVCNRACKRSRGKRLCRNGNKPQGRDFERKNRTKSQYLMVEKRSDSIKPRSNRYTYIGNQYWTVWRFWLVPHYASLTGFRKV